jgi:hypothetical protein
MKLKSIRIIAILIIITVVAFFVLRPRSAEKSSADNKTASRSAAQPNDSVDNKSSLKFIYVPEKVVNGTLYGVVEVGASGFNSFVINMDDKRRWEIVSKDTGTSLIYEGLATSEHIKAGLIKYRAAMSAKGVKESNMHFVISSGAQKQPKTSTIIKELRSLGFTVTTVTPEQEAKYALKATLPAIYYDNSFMVDLGSGNTKVSWNEEGSLKSIELPGSRYHEKGTLDEEVYTKVKELISKVPPEKGDVCFIIGGAPYSLVLQHRKGGERYTVLKAPGDYKAADKKMASGLNIYKAIIDGTQTDTFVFDWDASFSIGFLLDSYKL